MRPTPHLRKLRHGDTLAFAGLVLVAVATVAVGVLLILIEQRLASMALLAEDTWVVARPLPWVPGTLEAADLRRLPQSIGAPALAIQLGGLLAVLGYARMRRAKRDGASTLLLTAFGAGAGMLFAIVGFTLRSHRETSELVSEGAVTVRIDPGSGQPRPVLIAQAWTDAYPDRLVAIGQVTSLAAAVLVALSILAAIRATAAGEPATEAATDGPLAGSRPTAALAAIAAVCLGLPAASVGFEGIPWGDRPYVTWPAAAAMALILYKGLRDASPASKVLRLAPRRSVLVAAVGMGVPALLVAWIQWRDVQSFGNRGSPAGELAALGVPWVMVVALYLWIFLYHRSYARPVEDKLDAAEELLARKRPGSLDEAARILESGMSHASRYRGRLYLTYAVTYLNVKLLQYESSGQPGHLDDALELVHGESGLYELLIRSGQRGWGDARASSYWLQKVLTHVAYTLVDAYAYTASTTYLVDAIKILSHLSHRRGLHHWLDRGDTNRMLAMCLGMMHQAEPSWNYRTVLSAQHPGWLRAAGTPSLLELALEVQQTADEPGKLDIDEEVAPTNLLSAVGFLELTAWLETSDQKFLEKAIANYEEAQTEDHLYMSALVYREIADLPSADLDPIIQIGERLLAQDRNRHARSLILAEIGHATWFKYLQTTDPADLRRAKAWFESAGSEPDGPLYGRLNAVLRWAYLAATWADEDNLPIGIERATLRRESLAAFALAARLLPSVTLLSGFGSQPSNLLVQETDFAADAVAVAVALGELERAVEFYELGRLVTQERFVVPGLLPGLDSFGRATADELRRIHASLRAVEARGDLLHDTTGLFASLRYRARHRVRYTRELAEAMASLEGDPPVLGGFAGLSAAAASGPIVLFNLTETGADALILTSGGGVRHTRLPPEVSRSRIAALADELDRALGERLGHASPEFFEELNRWLWDNVVGPVVAGIDLRYSSRRGRARIWLCPSGQLGRLPLHTARDVHGRRLIDLAVPIYTTSLRTLIGLRQHRPPSREAMRSGFLGISDKPGPHGSGVPGVTGERLVAERHLPGIDVRLDDDADTRAFAELVRTTHWLHVACHGTSQTSSGGAGIVLSDRVLRAEEILRYRDVATTFALLPICGAARADSGLAGEALHTAAAMYRAGVPNVVGTLWEVYDHADPEMSKVSRMVREFYVALMGQPASKPPDMALAYRDAVTRLVAVAPEDLPHWCAFVCMAA